MLMVKNKLTIHVLAAILRHIIFKKKKTFCHKIVTGERIWWGFILGDPPYWREIRIGDITPCIYKLKIVFSWATLAGLKSHWQPCCGSNCLDSFIIQQISICYIGHNDVDLQQCLYTLSLLEPALIFNCDIVWIFPCIMCILIPYTFGIGCS